MNDKEYQIPVSLQALLSSAMEFRYIETVLNLSSLIYDQRLRLPPESKVPLFVIPAQAGIQKR